MAKTVITGVDGDYGAYVAQSIQSKMSKEDLIFTSPNQEALESYGKLGIATGQADFNVPELLLQAFAGGETLLLISLPFVGEKRRILHKNAVDAARAAGIKKIIYVSMVGAGDPLNKSLAKMDHEFTETYIKEAGGMEYIFLRESQHAEPMVAAFEQSANSGGILANNMSEGKMAYISRDDCTEASACVCAGVGEPNTVYTITGPELLTISEFVKIGSEVTGRDVKYVFIDDEQMYKTFDEMGVPRTMDGESSQAAFPFCSDDRVSFGRAIREDKLSYFTHDFQKLTGKFPLTVREIFKNIDRHLPGDRTATE